MAKSRKKAAALRHLTRGAALAAALANVTLALGGCGSGSSSNRPSGLTGGKTHVVARVAGQPISLAELEHRVSIEARTSAEPVPRPPVYSACVAHMRRQPSRAPAPADQLRAACQMQLKHFQESALEHLITARWIFGEATHEGISVSSNEAERELDRTASALGGRVRLANISRTTGESKTDLVRDFQLNAVTQRLFARIDSRGKQIGPNQIASYYAEHRRRYLVPARRDLEIVAAPSDKAASAARRALEAGASFATVVAHEPATQPQPILAQAGTVHGLPRGFYKEPRLDNAIFTASMHVLIGPVHIPLGYYVFEVTHAWPPHQRSLNEVRDSISEQLRREANAQSRAHFVSQWRARWRASTVCLPHYVVPKCAQYRGTASEDPYTLS